jgi:hypothetical protein
MDEIETELVVERRIDCVRRSDLKERVAVGDRPNDHLGSNIAGRTWPIVDDNLLAEPLRQRLSNQAPDNVGRLPARKADDEAHRSSRITFCPYDARSNRQRASARG